MPLYLRVLAAAHSRPYYHVREYPTHTCREDGYDIRRRHHELEQIAHEQALETMTRTVREEGGIGGRGAVKV